MVTIILESKDLIPIAHVELFGKLKEYEMDITRMVEEEAKEKKSKCLALESSIPSSDEENVEGFENENLTLLVRKFKRFLKKNNPKGRSFQQKHNFKKNDSTSPKFTCFEYGKPGHTKSKCSIYLKKQQGEEKKAMSQGNKKKEYIAWEENASNTTSDSSNEEEANICFMVDG